MITSSITSSVLITMTIIINVTITSSILITQQLSSASPSPPPSSSAPPSSIIQPSYAETGYSMRIRKSSQWSHSRLPWCLNAYNLISLSPVPHKGRDGWNFSILEVSLKLESLKPTRRGGNSLSLFSFRIHCASYAKLGLSINVTSFDLHLL